MFVGAMTLASCSSDENVLEETQQPEQVNGVPMAISFGASDVTSRLALTDLAAKDTNFKFEEGDKVYVFATDGTYLGDLELVDTRNDEKEGFFATKPGKGINVTDGQKVIVWYFGTEGIDESKLTVNDKITNLDYDLSLQTNGTSSKNAANAAMTVKFVKRSEVDFPWSIDWSTTAGKDDTPIAINSGNVVLNHIFAVGTFTLDIEGKTGDENYFSTLGVKRVLVTGSYNKVTLDLTKVASASVSPIVAGSEKYGNIIVHNLDNKRVQQDRERNELHFYIVPGMFSPVFTYIDNKDVIYTGYLSSTTLKAGDIIRNSKGAGKAVDMEAMNYVFDKDDYSSRSGMYIFGFPAMATRVSATEGRIKVFECNGKQFLLGATNMGSTDHAQAGSLFAFGETETKPSYTQQNYKYKTKAYSVPGETIEWEEYLDGNGTKRFRLAPAYDAAQVNIKGGWRMPTAEEMAVIANDIIDTDVIPELGIIYTHDTYLGFRITGFSVNIWFALDKEGDERVSVWTSDFNTSSTTFDGLSDQGKATMIIGEPNSQEGVFVRGLDRYQGHQIRPVFDLSILKE